jgi:predicted RNA methylase
MAAILFDLAFHAFMRVSDRIIDLIYGVSTAVERRYGDAEARFTRFGDPETNMPSYYLRLLALRRFLAPARDDVFVDLGCGTGRALFVFARAGVAQCRGVEFDAAACRTARENIRRFRGRGAAAGDGDIEIAARDAGLYRFTDETILYLFNPFGAQTVRAVLASLAASLEAAPRRVRIGYYHPVHQALLEACPWLRRIGTIRGFKTNIVIYETRSSQPAGARKYPA